jgi:hypothetical protein
MAQRNGTGMFPREVVQKPLVCFCQAKGPQLEPDRRSGHYTEMGRLVTNWAYKTSAR